MADSPVVLVVDDDPYILEFVEMVLLDEGYQVVTAANGKQALDVVTRGKAGLVLLDMRMPVMDGWEFAAALRENRIRVPVVVMTAAADAERRRAEIGAQGCLAKPFELDDLVRTVRAFFHAPA